MEVHDRFFQAPAGSFFLFGARGTGKSTWLRRAFPDALTLDLLHANVFRELSARPERLVEQVRGAGRKVVVIDEVQKVPELLSVVHALIEEKRGIRFVLTSSSARKLKRSGVDLLAGRAVLRTFHPFMAAELGERFQLTAALDRGCLPLVWGADDPSDVLRTYVALYLREEVQLEGLVRNVGNFSRFLEVASFSHASVLNVSAVAREAQVERKVVETYLDIVDDLLLGFRVPTFTRRAKRAVTVHPKFYYFDAGVFRSLRPTGPLDRPGEIDGAALEGLVAQHLRSWIAYGNSDLQLSFWRTRSGAEVDFVVYGKGSFYALEVKNARQVRGEDLRALKAFREDYPECRAILLHRGGERTERDGVLCIPCEAFLTKLVPGTSLDDAAAP
ncbi:MAG TPA: AAA family ATPase [Myxococcaceae bacterium]|nr:AAA family ATPase [Myxococcaceae bacterium]